MAALEYDFIANVADLRPVMRADHVLVFIGGVMYVVKSRSSTPVAKLPGKPDFVVGYYRYPEPHTEAILMKGVQGEAEGCR